MCVAGPGLVVGGTDVVEVAVVWLVRGVVEVGTLDRFPREWDLAVKWAPEYRMSKKSGAVGGRVVPDHVRAYL